MGLMISSIDGLVSAQGYELVVLTFGLSGLSPEGRLVHQNFQYMAEALGNRGMIVTGGYDREFTGNAKGFLEHVAAAIYNGAVASLDCDKGWDLPMPALVVLRRSEEGPPELGYFAVEGLGERDLIALFRGIVSSSERPGGIFEMKENALKKESSGIAASAWQALQLKPTIFGVGVDLKPVIESVAKKRSKPRN